MFRPELEDFIREGLTITEACQLMEAYYSCAIEGITVDKEGFKRLCEHLANEQCNFSQ